LFYISLFWDYFKNYLKTRLTYRTDFWIEIISDLAFQGLNLLFILIVFMHTPTLGGWTQAEMVFVYGFFMVPYGIFFAFFNLWNFADRYIVKGEMDRILTRPAYNLAQLILENMDPSSLAGAIVGMIIMAYSAQYTNIDWVGYDPFIFAVLVFSAVALYFGLYIILASISFFSDSPTGIFPLMWNIQIYGRYPVTIYNRLIQIILTFVLPFGFVGFYPAAYFLDRANWSAYAWISPLAGATATIIGLLIWNTGIRRYRGAGS
jgi:ABC-2 type transport system permease protein